MQTRKTEVAIIGAGSAGMRAYREARDLVEDLVLIEGGTYGTTCARVGCMPSKLLIAAAEAAHAVSHAPTFGIHPETAKVDGREVMRRVRCERDRFVGFVIEAIEDFDPSHQLRGEARFLDDHRLQVGEDMIVEAERIVIATGSRPVYPGFFAAAGDLLATNDDVFDWQDLPDSAAVFGAGVIGLELGQALHRLGVRVRLFSKGGGIGPLTDPTVRDYAAGAFAAEYPLMPDADVTAIDRDDNAVAVTYRAQDGTETTEHFATLLAATGRRPNVDKLALENTGLECDSHGIPIFDPHTGQCGDSHVFIAGDVNNTVPLLHEAADEGLIAGQNAARYPDVRAKPRRAPLSIVFCEPQIAMVGSTYKALEDEGGEFEIGEVSFENQGRSRVMAQNKGILRLYGEKGSGRFLGAEMIGPRAEHLGHLLAWALQYGATVQEMIDMPFYHPVIEEGVRTGLRQLNRKLRMGSGPPPNCLDCGPGG